MYNLVNKVSTTRSVLVGMKILPYDILVELARTFAYDQVR